MFILSIDGLKSSKGFLDTRAPRIQKTQAQKLSYQTVCHVEEDNEKQNNNFCPYKSLL